MDKHESYALSDTELYQPTVDQAAQQDARWRKAAAEWPTLRGEVAPSSVKPRPTHRSLTAVAVCLSILIGAALNEVIHAIIGAWMLHGGIH